MPATLEPAKPVMVPAPPEPSPVPAAERPLEPAVAALSRTPLKLGSLLGIHPTDESARQTEARVAEAARRSCFMVTPTLSVAGTTAIVVSNLTTCDRARALERWNTR
jgi:hypothetical protein